MHGLDVIIRRNNVATERELDDALAAGNIGLALRIAEAVISDALAKGVDASWPGYTPEAQAYELGTKRAAKRIDGRLNCPAPAAICNQFHIHNAA